MYTTHSKEIFIRTVGFVCLVHVLKVVTKYSNMLTITGNFCCHCSEFTIVLLLVESYLAYSCRKLVIDVYPIPAPASHLSLTTSPRQIIHKTATVTRASIDHVVDATPMQL